MKVAFVFLITVAAVAAQGLQATARNSARNTGPKVELPDNLEEGPQGIQGGLGHKNGVPRGNRGGSPSHDVNDNDDIGHRSPFGRPTGRFPNNAERQQELHHEGRRRGGLGRRHQGEHEQYANSEEESFGEEASAENGNVDLATGRDSSNFQIVSSSGATSMDQPTGSETTYIEQGSGSEGRSTGILSESEAAAIDQGTGPEDTGYNGDTDSIGTNGDAVLY